MKTELYVALVVALLSRVQEGSAVEIDENGYILYCPCMGRFGNQAEHFLGTLAFAKHLNRTLVLPPWVEYRSNSIKSVQVPFDKYFKVEPLLSYHRVMTMDRFMDELSSAIWPKGSRSVYCYRKRQAVVSADDGGCNAKDGNPFQSFWDTYDVNFVKSEYYEPLTFDVSFPKILNDWNNKFPVHSHLVLAFTGAPAAFPVRKQHAHLHKYLEWSEEIQGRAQQFIQGEIPAGIPYIGIHLRIGSDWINVCKHADDIVNSRRHLFASAQCLGYDFEKVPRLSLEGVKEMCLPSKDTILQQVKNMVKRTGIRVVFVATDSDNKMIEALSNHLADYKVRVIRSEPADAHVDLALLGQATYFIGSCTSTYSAFAVRERTQKGLPVDFWASHILAIGSDEL